MKATLTQVIDYILKYVNHDNEENPIKLSDLIITTENNTHYLKTEDGDLGYVEENESDYDWYDGHGQLRMENISCNL